MADKVVVTMSFVVDESRQNRLWGILEFTARENGGRLTDTTVRPCTPAPEAALQLGS